MATLAPPVYTPASVHSRSRVVGKRSLGTVHADPLRFTRAPLLLAALAFAAGILVARFCWISSAWLGIAACLQGLLASLAARRCSRMAMLPLTATWLLLGAFAAQLQPAPPRQDALRMLAHGSPVALRGVVQRTSPPHRILSQRPFSEEQVVEQMESVDLHVLAASEPDDAAQQVAGGVRLSLYADADATLLPLHCGDVVTVTATLRPPERYRDTGVWDSSAWLLSQGIGAVGSAHAERLARTALPRSSSLTCTLHAWQTAASDRLVQFADVAPPRRMPGWLTLSHEDAAMLAAMATGDRTYLGRALRAGFERTGSFHLLVVSGLHVGLFAALVFGIGRRLRIGRVPLTAITLLLSAVYALLTGFGQPVQRALAMLALYLVGRLLYRERSGLNSLGFAALCLLAFSPRSLFDAGLQMTLLTVVAVVGIAIPLLERTTAPFLLASRRIDVVGMDASFVPRMAQFRVTLRMIGEHLEPFLSRRWRRTRRAQRLLALVIRCTLLLLDACLISAAIELTMALPMAVYFHRITTLGLPVNVLIVPALTVLLPCALLTTLSAVLAPHLTWLPAAATAALLHAVTAVVHWGASFSISDWRMAGPGYAGASATFALLALAMGCARWPKRIAVPLCSLILLAAAGCVLLPRHIARRPNTLEVTALDVGQGDALLIVSPDGHTLLVDAGGPTGGARSHSGNFEIGEDVVSPYLWSRGIRRLDAVALTHAHSDHMGGMPAVLRNFHPRELWVGHNPDVPAYTSLLANAAAAGTRTRTFSAGDTLQFGGAAVHVLAPASGYEPGSAPTNNDSLVMSVAFEGHAALLEGDAEAPSESAMLALPGDALHADLLKVGHHGSKTSTIPPFLERVAPRFAVVSVGPYNSYHHPRWETLEKLQQQGARTWRTDLLGLSTFYIDRNGVTPAPAP